MNLAVAIEPASLALGDRVRFTKNMTCTTEYQSKKTVVTYAEAGDFGRIVCVGDDHSQFAYQVSVERHYGPIVGVDHGEIEPI